MKQKTHDLLETVSEFIASGDCSTGSTGMKVIYNLRIFYNLITSKPICPQCGIRFSYWFFWPGIGDFCWPCYEKTREIFTAKGKQIAALGGKK